MRLKYIKTYLALLYGGEEELEQDFGPGRFHAVVPSDIKEGWEKIPKMLEKRGRAILEGSQVYESLLAEVSKNISTSDIIKRIEEFSNLFTVPSDDSEGILQRLTQDPKREIAAAAKTAIGRMQSRQKEVERLTTAGSPLTAKKIMQTRVLFGGNWKERKDLDTEEKARDKAGEFANTFLTTQNLMPHVAELLKGAEIVIFPEAKWIPAVADELKDTNIRVGVQSLFFGDPANPADFTPEALQAKIDAVVKMGAQYANIAHSMHRLKGKGLTNEQANKIMHAILKDGRLIPWYTIEVSGERDAKDEIADGIDIGLAGISEEQILAFPITPEPTALISTKEGTGKIDESLKTKVDAQDTAQLSRLILEALEKKFGHPVDVNVGYGASVGPTNAKSIFSNKVIRNALIGGQSLEAQNFLDTVVNGMKGKAQASSALTKTQKAQKGIVSLRETIAAREAKEVLGKMTKEDWGEIGKDMYDIESEDLKKLLKGLTPNRLLDANLTDKKGYHNHVLIILSASLSLVRDNIWTRSYGEAPSYQAPLMSYGAIVFEEVFKLVNQFNSPLLRLEKDSLINDINDILEVQPKAEIKKILEQVLQKLGAAPPQVVTAPGTTGGIDLQGINVGVSQSSKPMNAIPIFREGMKPLFFNPADFAGFSFKIIKIEDIKDFNTVLNAPPEKNKKEFAYIG